MDCPALFSSHGRVARLRGLQPAFIRPWPDCTACHQNFPPMPVLKKMLSTDMLPQGLSERQRFMFFAELFEHFSNTGELDPAEDVPFRAAMNSIHVGTTMLGRCDGTFTTVRREKRQVLATNDDRYCLARNTGSLQIPRHPSRPRIRDAAGIDGAAQARRAVLRGRRHERKALHQCASADGDAEGDGVRCRRSGRPRTGAGRGAVAGDGLQRSVAAPSGRRRRGGLGHRKPSDGSGGARPRRAQRYCRAPPGAAACARCG